MIHFTITDEAAGEQHWGSLPAGWHEVPLAFFMRYDELQQLHGPGSAFHHIIAALTGLPLLALEEDATLALRLSEYLCFVLTLPAGAPVLTITHEGQLYHYVADLSPLSVARYESVLAYLERADLTNPVQAVAHLLAVLYVPATRIPTADELRQQAEAFQRLPMDVAWPAYAHFLARWSKTALAAQAVELAQLQICQALDQTEQALRPADGQPRPLVARATRSMMRRYLRHMRQQVENI